MPHLLLVDDDPEAIEWLSELAKAEGFTVATADSLRDARIHMSRLQPDIVLIDLQLPDGSGIELFERPRDARHDRGRADHRPRQRRDADRGAAPAARPTT